MEKGGFLSLLKGEGAMSSGEGVLAPWSMEKVRQQVEVQIKYDGYLRQQTSEIKRFARMERRQIPADFDFDAIRGLLTETRQKMKAIRPPPLDKPAASRSHPADISLLLVHWSAKEAVL